MRMRMPQHKSAVLVLGHTSVTAHCLGHPHLRRQYFTVRGRYLAYRRSLKKLVIEASGAIFVWDIKLNLCCNCQHHSLSRVITHRVIKIHLPIRNGVITGISP